MLAAHRDQENLVQSHQVPAKQQPKTPGARYPKTPHKVPLNDENGATAFRGKSGKMGDGKIMTVGKGGRQNLMTPMGMFARSTLAIAITHCISGNAPRTALGNKTTNAKAKATQGQGVKDIVKDIEKTRGKATTVSRPQQKPVNVAPIKFQVRADGTSANNDDVAEPEYAPPRPEPLPYESDCLPKGGLRRVDLKHEDMLKGFYQHFHNPTDEKGVSRKDKEFEEEMKKAMDDAIEQNVRDAEQLDWSVADVPETIKCFRKDTEPAKPVATRAPASSRQNRNPSTLTSQIAAAALAMPSRAPKATSTVRPPQPQISARRPFGQLRAAKPTKTPLGPSSANNAAGEVASRTTLGYSKGRFASSAVHSRDVNQAKRPVPAPAKTPATTAKLDNDPTLTPARARQAAKSQPVQAHRPQFLSIFNDDDDEELAPLGDSEGVLGEEEEFELKLDF